MRLAALQEVGPSVFFSLLVIAVAFLPVFTLVDQEGRLFRPLAFTKNLAMAIAALLAMTLDPALRMLFARMEPFSFRPRLAGAGSRTRLLVGTLLPRGAASRSAACSSALYEPACRFVLRHPRATIVAALALVVADHVPVYLAARLASSCRRSTRARSSTCRPTLPGMSVAEAQRGCSSCRTSCSRTFPEVERVFGKAGRAETSTDPAPLSMMETTVVLKPDVAVARRPRWYSAWAPDWLKPLLRPLWPDRISLGGAGRTRWTRRSRFPGITNAWTMPIKDRIDMLSTGIRTPVGIKVFGADLAEIERSASSLEAILRKVPGTRSVYAERVAGGYFLDFDLEARAAGALRPHASTTPTR